MSEERVSPEMPVKRVVATDAAIAMIEKLKGRHGDLMFHQSGGCCDGSAPMCFSVTDFKTGDSDLLLGEIADCPFYISRTQFEYFQYSQLIIDLVPGRGASFSLEIPEGFRFLTRSRLFTDEESAVLPMVTH